MPMRKQTNDLPSLEASALPREFAGMPPINPRDRGATPPDGWRRLAGLAADVDYYGRWVRDEAMGRLPAREHAALATLSNLVGRARPYIVHDMIDHYSTGSSSPHATVERDVDSYADAIVGCLRALVGVCAAEADPFSDGPGSWAAHLVSFTRAIEALSG